MYSFGNCDKSLACAIVYRANIGIKLVQVKIGLRQIYKVGTAALIRCQRGSSGQPPGMTSHYFNNRDHSGIVNTAVLVYFHAGGGDIFCSAAETGAVIRAEEIVVYGFGNAHNAAFVSGALHISADFGAGVHA